MRSIRWSLAMTVLGILALGATGRAALVELIYPQSDDQGHYVPAVGVDAMTLQGLVGAEGRPKSVVVNDRQAEILPACGVGCPLVRAGQPVMAFKVHVRLTPATPLKVAVVAADGTPSEATFQPDAGATLGRLEARLKEAPDEPAGHLRLANALRDRGKLKAAVARYRKALDLDPALVAAYVGLGATLHARSALALLEARRKAGETGAADYGLHFHLGNCLCDDMSGRQMGRAGVLAGQTASDQALAALQRAIELAPQCLPAYLGLGCLLCERDRSDEGLAAFRKAVEIAPDDFEAHFRVACTLRRQGKTEESIAAQQRALELCDWYGPAHACLAHALYAKEDYAGAWRQVHRAQECGAALPAQFLNALRAKMPEPQA